MTADSYDLDHRVEEKLEIMRPWCAWVDEWAVRAVEDDPRLADVDWLKQQVQTARDRDKKPKAGR